LSVKTSKRAPQHKIARSEHGLANIAKKNSFRKLERIGIKPLFKLYLQLMRKVNERFKLRAS